VPLVEQPPQPRQAAAQTAAQRGRKTRRAKG